MLFNRAGVGVKSEKDMLEPRHLLVRLLDCLLASDGSISDGGVVVTSSIDGMNFLSSLSFCLFGRERYVLLLLSFSRSFLLPLSLSYILPVSSPSLSFPLLLLFSLFFSPVFFLLSVLSPSPLFQ